MTRRQQWRDGEDGYPSGGARWRGIAGIAWEIGLLAGFLDRGITLNDADLVVGTSAGSVVGALLRLDGIGGALAEQLTPIEDQPTAGNGFDSTEFMADLAAATQGAKSDQDARVRLGVVARMPHGGLD
jgi:NTE family protein